MAKVEAKLVFNTTMIAVSRDRIITITMDPDNISNEETNLIITKMIMVIIRNLMEGIIITTDTART